MSREIRLEIIEQPKQRGMRFRYECEGRSAGSIPGENTTNDKKTWPACEIKNYQGMAIIRVSLVSKDDPPRPHPHSLVGRDCNNGICQLTIDPSSQMQGLFPNLGIQCVRRKEVSASIRERLNLGVNPFDATINGDERATIDVDLNIVRLCFEAFLPDHHGNYTQRLQPVVSNPIYDKKATSSSVLKICRVDKISGSVLGKELVFLLCDKVQKEDIQVVFSHKGWEALGDFSSPDVHRQVAIVFKTPPYQDENIQESVDVEVKLRRPSDMETSAPLTFTYTPVQQNYLYNQIVPETFMSRQLPDQLKRKFREAFNNKAKRIHAADDRGFGVKRPPMPVNRVDPSIPGPSRPIYPTQFRHHWPPTGGRPPIVRTVGSSSIQQFPPQTSVKKEFRLSDYNAPFPSSQPSFPPSSAAVSPFTNIYTSNIPPVGEGNTGSVLPILNPTIDEQQIEFGLDSLPSLGVDGTSEVLQNSTLTVPPFTAASNLPKLEEPILPQDLDILMQHCSIEKTEPNGPNFLQMLQDSNPGPSHTTPSSDIYNVPGKFVVPQQQTRHEVFSPIIHQQSQQKGGNQMFLPSVMSSQMTSPGMTPHPMSTISGINHNTGMNMVSPTAAPPHPTFTASDIMSPAAMSPHAASSVMSPAPSAGVMSPNQMHDNVPIHSAMSPDPQANLPPPTPPFYHQPSSMPGEMQHPSHNFNHPSHHNFNQLRNNNNNNHQPLVNQTGQETMDSFEEILKTFT